MPTDTETAVDELLADLAGVFDDESTGDAGEPDPEALDELADRAGKLVSSTDLSELLVASGLGDDDEPPASLPAAIASGAPQNVARLRSLLTASKLSTGDDGREERVDELQSLVETAQGDPSAEAESSGDAAGDETETSTDATGEETESTEAEATKTESTEAEATEEPTDRESTETQKEGDEESSPIRDLLKSQLEETHGIFDSIPDIETLTGGLGEDEDDTDRDEKDGDDAEHAETTDTDESHEDESTRKSDGTRWRPGGGKQATYSTVPGAGRRDIGRRAGSFSSVRGSTVSKR